MLAEYFKKTGKVQKSLPEEIYIYGFPVKAISFPIYDGSWLGLHAQGAKVLTQRNLLDHLTIYRRSFEKSVGCDHLPAIARRLYTTYCLDLRRSGWTMPRVPERVFPASSAISL